MLAQDRPKSHGMTTVFKDYVLAHETPGFVLKKNLKEFSEIWNKIIAKSSTVWPVILINA